MLDSTTTILTEEEIEELELETLFCDLGIDIQIEGLEHVNVSAQAQELEAQGWRVWLMTLCPFAFEEDFSADHIKFWDLFWSVLLRIREQRKYFALGVVPDDPDNPQLLEQYFRNLNIWIEDDEFVVLCIWGRGLGKSATVEAGVVARGCLLGSGYCLYVCRESGQAEEHIDNCRGLIADDDSRVSEFYPHMAIDENATFKGKKTKNRTDLFVTAGGWICRAKGLEASLRGIRVGNLRPDSIVIDDVDDVDDSIAVSLKLLSRISASVIPTQARRHATILVGQNIIIETGVINQIYTGHSDVLSARTSIGISNTFEQFRINLEYVTYMDDASGNVRHKILPSARPTWKGVNLATAQKFLNDSGLPTFLAEYMNSFAHQKTGKVFEYDEKRHVITWDMFEQMFGVRHIPGHWRAKAAGDIGYSKESLSAWLFVARSAQNAKLPGLYFGHRSLTFEMDSIEDQAIDIWKSLFPDTETGKRHFEATQDFARYPELVRAMNLDSRYAPFLKRFDYNPVKNQYDLRPLDQMTLKDISEEEKALFYVKDAKRTFRSQIQSWVISHEKTGEQKTLAKMYGIPASKVKRFEADAGVAEANHLLRGDYTLPHPFYDDEIVPETGLYKLGRPYFYFIVRRIQAPEGDQDFKTFRQQVGNQRWTQEKLGELGLSKSIPFKYQSDHCFVAGTMVTTERGQVPIEQVGVGDMILTRKGYRRCKAARMTNPSAEIWRLNIDGRGELRGTRNHPVWTEDKGLIPLELVGETDKIIVCENSSNLHHSDEKPSFLQAIRITDIQTRLGMGLATITEACGVNGRYHYTSLFGSPFMGLCRPDVLFITPITTRSITTSATSNALLGGNINGTMSLRPVRKPYSQGRQVLLRPYRWRRLLGSPSRVEKPSEQTQRKHGKLVKGLQGLAGFVSSLLRRFSPIRVNTVPKLVSRRCAGKPYSEGVKLPVYNLSVDGVHEYFANGILVANCDALRMFATDYALPESTPKTVEEEIQARIPEERKHKPGQTVEEFMSAQAAREYATAKTKEELGLDDDDMMEGYDYDDD